MEEIDNLLFNNQRLTKRILVMQEEEAEKAKSDSGNTSLKNFIQNKNKNKNFVLKLFFILYFRIFCNSG